MMVIGLNEAKIGGITHLKSVVSVQLKQSRGNQICANLTLIEVFTNGRYIQGFINGQTAEIEGLIDLVHEISLTNENEFLDGMVEIRLDVHLGLKRSDGNQRRILDLLNEILVALGHKAPALLYVQVDIVAPHQHAGDIDWVDICIIDTFGIGSDIAVPEQGVQRRNSDIDANGVILKG